MKTFIIAFLVYVIIDGIIKPYIQGVLKAQKRDKSVKKLKAYFERKDIQNKLKQELGAKSVDIYIEKDVLYVNLDCTDSISKNESLFYDILDPKNINPN